MTTASAPSRTARLARAEAWLPPLSALVLIAAWELSTRLFGISDLVLPPPSWIGKSLWQGITAGVFLHHAAITAMQAAAGFVTALAVGVALGTAIAEIRLVDRALYPFLVGFQAMPKVALAPLVIIWFGYGMSSKIVLAAAIACFPILVNTVAGLKSCEAGKIDVMRALGASRWQIFRLVRFPNALPYIFAGMHVAAAFCVLGSVVGEFLGSKEGLGTLILIANGTLDVTQVFAVLVMLGTLGFSFFTLIRVAQRRLLRWAPLEALQRG